jgi:hypothetical protein
MYGLTKARRKISWAWPRLGKEGNLPISSGGTGHSMVAGLDSFPSVPMNRPSPRIVQTMTDKPEEDILTVLSKQNL